MRLRDEPVISSLARWMRCWRIHSWGDSPVVHLKAREKWLRDKAPGLGQVGDRQAFAEVGEDQLLGDALTPGAQATGGGQPGGILLESGHDKYPQSMGTFPVDGCSVDALNLVAGPPG